MFANIVWGISKDKVNRAILNITENLHCIPMINSAGFTRVLHFGYLIMIITKSDSALPILISLLVLYRYAT